MSSRGATQCQHLLIHTIAKALFKIKGTYGGIYSKYSRLVLILFWLFVLTAFHFLTINATGATDS